MSSGNEKSWNKTKNADDPLTLLIQNAISDRLIWIWIAQSSNIFMPCFWPLDFNNCLTYSKNQFEKVTFIKIKKRKIENKKFEIQKWKLLSFALDWYRRNLFVTMVKIVKSIATMTFVNIGMSIQILCGRSCRSGQVVVHVRRLSRLFNRLELVTDGIYVIGTQCLGEHSITTKENSLIILWNGMMKLKN